MIDNYGDLCSKGDNAISENLRNLFLQDYDMCACAGETFDKDPTYQYLILKNNTPTTSNFGDNIFVPVQPTINDEMVLEFIKKAILLSTRSIDKAHLYLLQTHYKDPEYDAQYTTLVGRENRRDIKPVECDQYLYLDIDGYYLLPECQYFGAYVCNFIGFGLFCNINNILRINE